MPPKGEDFPNDSRTNNVTAIDQEASGQSECLSQGDPLSDVPSCRPSKSPELHSPERTPPLARSRSPERTVSLAAHHSTVKNPLRLSRSRSPYARHHFAIVFRFTREELSLVRLIPYKNPNRVFELRKYTFPQDNPEIQLRATNRVLRPMPTEEQIVLSMANGDVYAILEKAKNYTVLRGIYTSFGVSQQRAKININTGAVTILTAEERAEIPLGTREPILKCFKVENI